MSNNITPLYLDMKMARGKPNTFKEGSPALCPFCDKDSLYEARQVLEEKNGVLWIDNKFPTLKYTKQTLIIEHPNCSEDLTTYSSEHANFLFDFAFEKRRQMLESGEFKDVIFFKNHGWLSGGSVKHEHMQLVGLEDVDYPEHRILESTNGPTVYSNESLKVTVSSVPLSEIYEFNVVWTDAKHDYVKWIQNTLRFLKVFWGGKFDNYNLMYHQEKGVNVIKIVPRHPESIYLLGFGLHQAPTDAEEVAKEFKQFLVGH